MDEFDVIHRYFAPLTRGDVASFGLTDDAAAIPSRAGFAHVITTDAIVQGVHFLEDETPANIAHRLCGSNLSDLAAMGAAPVGFTLAAAWKKGTDARFIEQFAAGLGEWVDAFKFPLLGGDTVVTTGPMTFSLTAIGEVEDGRALTRGGAKPGDTVYVTGTIGDGALGLRAAKGELPDLSKAHVSFLSERFRRPQPRVDAGRALVGRATACIDISDGLVQDLGHICSASGTALRIDARCVPLSDAARSAIDSDPVLIDTILTGGDDYELAFTAHGDLPAADVPLTAIGEVAAGSGGVTVTGFDGEPMTFAHGGFNHFTGT
ncbi:MAG: thiamine-phosphate kinase [Rhodospirillales bacterium]|nr:thiamine-phosphate kinase [Rhodospirillales bacterium]MBO6786812.1 thiamine-phosphate kinase [Rhodospirillales bacterium]